jgi:hypothetical protein
MALWGSAVRPRYAPPKFGSWGFIKTRGTRDRVTIRLQDLILTKGDRHAPRFDEEPLFSTIKVTFNFL